MIRRILPLLALIALAAAPAGQVAYHNDFQQAEPGSLPEEMLLLSGTFAVKQEGDNRYLELAPQGLGGFGVMLGPAGQHTAIEARIRSSPRGRRFPEFGIGLGGMNGFKLWLMPAIDELRIIRDEYDIVARAPYHWKGGTWTHLRMEIVEGEGKWIIRGKAWEEGAQPPKDWTVQWEQNTPPRSGRATLWGTPYAETAIGFDDVVIETSPAR
jgi:hypothetical protein